MTHIANIRLGLVEFLLLVGGALTWTSCINDNIDYDMGYDEGYDVVDNEVEKVSVRLSVSAGQSGGISVSRADDDDEYALEGEYMNSLCVFVVDANNTIVARFEPTSDTEWAGDNSEWSSEEVDEELTLATGAYTVYAFSNWETVASENGDDWSEIIAKTEGGTISDDDLAIDIDDPASKVDLTNDDVSQRKYIPMSGKQEITVTQEGESFEVSMDRLVGRVEVTIYGESGADAADITLNSFTFGYCADKVPLMKVEDGGTASPAINYDEEYVIDFGDDGMIIEAAAEGESPNKETFYFYVNETSNTTGFGISLSTTRGREESLYTATTNTTEIPRNYILPISLSLQQYTLDLGIHAYAAAIDTEETEYFNVTSDENDNCIIQLLEVTTMFTMTPAIKDPDGTEVSDVTWSWAKTGSTENDNIEISEPDDEGVYTFTNLTATTGHEYTFSLTAEWTTDRSVTQKRTYNIQITLVNGRPQYNGAPARSSWQGWYWTREQLNMYRRH